MRLHDERVGVAMWEVRAMVERAPQGAVGEPGGLEPGVEDMRRRAAEVLERVVGHMAGLGSQPASYDESLAAPLAASLREPLPWSGASLEEALAVVFDRALGATFNTASPGYLAYIPGGGLYDAALADFIASAINRYVGVWVAAPGLVQLETNVVRWFCQVVGYPDTALGSLTTGGSMANLTAVIAARVERLGEDFLDGVVYASAQAHHSVAKAAAMAGLPRRQVRIVDTDGRQRMNLEALAEAVAQDRRAGLRPFMVVGNAGTTNTGAIDDLGGLAALAQAEGLWLHVDAAYGGFFALTGRGKALLAGIEQADSITLDPHKGLFMPYGSGAVLVRRREALERAFDQTGDYMPDFQGEPDHVDYCRLTPELSRSFRGLRIWLPFKLHGARAFQGLLDEKLALAGEVAEALEALPGVEVIPPQLSVVAFRAVRSGLDGEALDALNRRWLQRINDRRRVFMTGTTLEGRFVLRICVLSVRTHRPQIEAALEDTRAALAEALLEVGAGA